MPQCGVLVAMASSLTPPACACVHCRVACLQGGGRKKRDKHISSVLKEMSAKYARDVGARPNLLVN